MDMKKTVAVVPVKLNNERLPGKNTKPFHNGQPLITYILKTLKQVKGLDGIYVYCSDPSIRDYLPEGVTYLPRDKKLDLSSTSILDVLLAFASDVPAENYVLAHATAPFLSADSIQKGLDAVVHGGHDSAMAVRKLRDFLWKDGVPLYDTRTYSPHPGFGRLVRRNHGPLCVHPGAFNRAAPPYRR